MNENIQTNNFYSALIDHIPGVESQCVKNGWMLCIPQSAALPESHRISLRLLKMHVLIPGANHNEYNTLNSTVVIKRNGEKELEAYQDGSLLTTVSILYKEIIYCGSRGDQSYMVLCISRPLDGYGQVPLLDDGREAFAEDRSAEEWDSLLYEDIFARKQLLQLESTVAALENPLEGKKEPIAYMLIREFAERMCKENLDTRFEAARLNHKFMSILQTAFETTAAAACHPVLFASLCQKYALNEKQLQTRLHDLRRSVIEQGNDSEKDGLTKDFLSRFDFKTSPAFAHAADALQQINERKSPLEKLWCLRNASRSLREMPGNDNMDDSLPLFLLCLTSAAPGLLLANLYFMTDFAPRLWVKSAGELSFHCTVLSGAISLIQQHHVENDEEEGNRSLLKNLVMFGGTGLHPIWETNPASPTRISKQDATKSPFAWFESCAPVFRG